MFIIGLDLGQAQDYTAIMIVERSEPKADTKRYDIRHIERTRGAPYTEIIDRVIGIMDKLAGADLVVDQTGVGAPVVDSFRKAGIRNLIPVYIHGGDRVSFDTETKTYRVPKRDLVGVAQVLLQNKELKCVNHPMAKILQDELRNFKMKIDPVTAHDSYSAWRERDHDDLVLAAALACWWGDRPRKSYSYSYSGGGAVTGGPVRAGADHV